MSPRRQPPDRWPWPQDSLLQRRERIARGYRDALHRADPDTAVLLDERCADWGQTWVLGSTRRRLPENELLDTAQVAEHFDVTPRAVDQWRYRDGLACVHTPDGVRYRYGVVVEFLQQRRNHRAGRAQDTPQEPVSGPAASA